MGGQNLNVGGNPSVQNVNVVNDVTIDDSTPVRVNTVDDFPTTDFNSWYLIRQNSGGNKPEDMRFNFSSSPTEYAYTPSRDFLVRSLSINVGGFQINQIGHSNFGAINGLTNGILLKYDLDGRTVDIQHQRNIFNNRDLIAQCDEFKTFDFPEDGDSGTLFVCRFDFTNLTDGGILLRSGTGDKIYTVLNDNFQENSNGGLFEFSMSLDGSRLAP